MFTRWPAIIGLRSGAHDLGRSSPRGRPSPNDYFSILITPTPIAPRSRSGSFKRAFSAATFVLNGFDNGVNRPSTYLKRSHCSVIFVMMVLRSQ